MIESRFSLRAYLLPWAILLIAAAACYVVSNALSRSSNSFEMMLIALGVAVVAVILLFGELRTRTARITIEGNQMIARNLLGLGRRREIDLSGVDGYMIADQRVATKGVVERYEHLYIMSGDRKVLKIVDAYYRNYPELKKAIASRTKRMGKKEFSLIDDYQE